MKRKQKLLKISSIGNLIVTVLYYEIDFGQQGNGAQSFEFINILPSQTKGLCEYGYKLLDRNNILNYLGGTNLII